MKEVLPLIGSVVLALVGVASLLDENTQDKGFGYLFAGIGCVILLLIIYHFCAKRKNRKKAQRLIEGGKFVWAEIAGYDLQYRLRLGREDYYYYSFWARYFDGKGGMFAFQSESIEANPSKDIIGQRVKVYVEDETCATYYLDEDGILALTKKN